MFDVKVQNRNEISLFGRFDASQVEKVEEVLKSVTDNCTIDFKELEYISSAGLGELVKTYSKLKALDKTIVLINLNKHVLEVFRYAGLDKVFLL